MKKIIAICAVLALAAGMAAANNPGDTSEVTVSDWYAGGSVVTVADGTNGFSLVPDDNHKSSTYSPAIGNKISMLQLQFASYDVNGWLLDCNDEFQFVIDLGGYEDDTTAYAVMGPNNYGIPYPSQPINTTGPLSYMELVLSSNPLGNNVTYRFDWAGNGTYTANADALQSAVGSNNFEVGIATLKLYNTKGNIANIYGFDNESAISFSFVEVESPVEEDDVVPEPATIAYAAMGLVSAFGLKRRIKK